MLAHDQMDKIKKQLEKLSSVMQKVEDLAASEIHTEEDYLQVCGAMLAVTRNMYIRALGPEDTARMFATVADSFMIQEDILHSFPRMEKPTIH